VLAAILNNVHNAWKIMIQNILFSEEFTYRTSFQDAHCWSVSMLIVSFLVNHCLQKWWNLSKYGKTLQVHGGSSC